MRSFTATLSLLILIVLLTGCGTRPPTPLEVAPTSIAATATWPSMATATIAPAPSLEPSATFSPSPRPIVSPRPTFTPTPQPITITLFTIEPATLDPGDAITITWRTTGGQVSLIPINPLGQMSPSIPVDNNDSLIITTDKSQRAALQYMLNVHDARLKKDIQAFASAAFTCPDVWFFPDGPAGCPQAPAVTGLAAIQHFEHGLMIWFQPRNSIFVLYADDRFSPKWDQRQDNYINGQPESDPTLIPPIGKFQPVRGFGLVWRDEEYQPVIRVRDRLGWAIDEEEPFQGALQCNSAIKYTTCYLKDDRGRTIELKPERSAWSYYPKPQ